MSRWEAWIAEIESDPDLPRANKAAILASLRAVIAAQEVSDSVPMDAENSELLGRATRYLVLADRIYSREPRVLMAILLAVCDLQKIPTKT